MSENQSRLAGLTEIEQALYDRVSKSLSENEVNLAEIKSSSTYALDVALIKDAISILKDHIAALESLAASRASEARKKKLLEKHQWIWDKDKEHYKCIECSKTYPMGTLDWKMIHAPDCALDAELEGGE